MAGVIQAPPDVSSITVLVFSSTCTTAAAATQSAFRPSQYDTQLQQYCTATTEPMMRRACSLAMLLLL
jgi:hypothetical protein